MAIQGIGVYTNTRLFPLSFTCVQGNVAHSLFPISLHIICFLIAWWMLSRPNHLTGKREGLRTKKLSGWQMVWNSDHSLNSRYSGQVLMILLKNWKEIPAMFGKLESGIQMVKWLRWCLKRLKIEHNCPILGWIQIYGVWFLGPHCI